MLVAKLLKACPVSSTLSSPISDLEFHVKQFTGAMIVNLQMLFFVGGMLC
jgi:hypothetical protein